MMYWDEWVPVYGISRQRSGFSVEFVKDGLSGIRSCSDELSLNELE